MKKLVFLAFALALLLPATLMAGDVDCSLMANCESYPSCQCNEYYDFNIYCWGGIVLEANCRDGIDNNLNGLIDCDDRDSCGCSFDCSYGCEVQLPSRETGRCVDMECIQLACTNCHDDDNNGYTDCKDLACAGYSFCAQDDLEILDSKVRDTVQFVTVASVDPSEETAKKVATDHLGEAARVLENIFGAVRIVMNKEDSNWLIGYIFNFLEKPAYAQEMRSWDEFLAVASKDSLGRVNGMLRKINGLLHSTMKITRVGTSRSIFIDPIEDAKINNDLSTASARTNEMLNEVSDALIR